MSRIVIHAGMPKAGSSSVQGWLADNAQWFEEELNGCLGVAEVGTAGSSDQSPVVRVAPFDGRRKNSGQFWSTYWKAKGTEVRAQLIDELIRQLDELSARYQTVVLSSEAFAQPFWRPEPQFLEGLDRLSERHEVEVAYYVRPQHSSLEAAWRQWGFRSGQAPSEYLLRRSEQLDYEHTLQTIRERKGGFWFEIRPFRSDLLDEGDVNVDFVQRFLKVEEVPQSGGEWKNPGLPLELANALREAPEGLFYTGLKGNKALNKIKDLIADLDLRDDERIELSRLTLRRYCYERFEEGNRFLISEMGWDCETFIEPVPGEPEEDGADIDLLDELWTSRASKVELQVLYRALDRAIRSS